MKIVRFINSIFTSNSYIIDFDKCNYAFVVDPGDSKPIIDWLKNSDKSLKGILITHSHFDHIYGINGLYEHFPLIQIFASENAKEGMQSAKLNSSYYTENPFVVECENIKIIAEADNIQLTDDISAKVIDSKGHNNDCLSFEIEQFLFTGDALIPGIKVHTKSKFGNKTKANESIHSIYNKFESTTLICPGHGEISCLGKIEISKLLNS